MRVVPCSWAMFQMFHKGVKTWNTWNILHTARKCAHDSMHNSHQQADDSMIVGEKGLLHPQLVGLSAIAYAEHT